MSEQKTMVIVVTRNGSDERSSVAWSVANGAIATGFRVTMFLVADGVDWARKGAAEHARPNPLDPSISEMMQTVIDNGGDILVCPPCAKVRGYAEDDLIEGATLAGSVAMHARIAEGAATLSF